jgi:hypothetical protein
MGQIACETSRPTPKSCLWRPQWRAGLCRGGSVCQNVDPAQEMTNAYHALDQR